MDYIKEFDGLLLDESKSDGELLSIARDYIAELQGKRKEEKPIEWNAYLLYLKEWADNHKGLEFFGMSPACFAEWQDNEAASNEICEGDAKKCAKCSLCDTCSNAKK